MNVINTLVTDKQYLATRGEDKKTKDWRVLIFVLEEYKGYHDEFLEWLEPFARMWDGHLERIVKHRTGFRCSSMASSAYTIVWTY